MKQISQEMFIKTVDMNNIDGEEIITIIYKNNLKITSEEMEKLLYVIREFYDYIIFCGFSSEETHTLFKAIMKKYGNLTPKEIMQVLYNAMTSCREESSMDIEERLMYIDGLWFTSINYAAYRKYLKEYDLDDKVQILLKTLDRKQGFFLTEKEKEYMTLGIINATLILDEIEKGKQKKL